MSESFGADRQGEDLEQLCVDTIRVLSMDAVEKAKSGHPGMPMGTADLAHVLWTQFLRLDPSDPDWIGRDRFVLSAGHGSMLIYSLLHLAGYDLTLDDLKSFRQLGSKTPGHPENFVTKGVETTTGPLGQGISNAVGMALAERHLCARFPELEPVLEHRTWVIASDGDLMEGVAAEACSLAGHLGLGRLIVLYDDNKISIDGSTELSFTEDVPERFEALGWQCFRVNGHDRAEIQNALEGAMSMTHVPTLIACRTTIGYGSPNKGGKSSSHGAPLGKDELQLAKEMLGWPQDPFLIPSAVQTRWQARRAEWQAARAEWDQKLAALRESHKEQVETVLGWLEGGAPDLGQVEWPSFPVGEKVATRKASGAVIQALAKGVPQLLGGSADLAGSNNTDIKSESGETEVVVNYNHGHRNVRYGVREHAMGAMMNGMALHGGVIPFGGTFLIFSDYCRPAIRLSALMQTHVVWVMTHDSVFLGEDGPTHQPVEHLAALRAIPGLFVIRPGDAAETVMAWNMAMQRRGPSLLCLTRQGLPTLDREQCAPAEDALKGGYVLWQQGDTPDVVLFATGSELHVALEVAQTLAQEGKQPRVVSLPCWEAFEAQDQGYRDTVLAADCLRRISIEAGATFGWERYTGPSGLRIGIDRFGASGPAADLAEHFGLSVPRVLEAVRSYLA